MCQSDQILLKRSERKSLPVSPDRQVEDDRYTSLFDTSVNRLTALSDLKNHAKFKLFIYICRTDFSFEKNEQKYYRMDQGYSHGFGSGIFNKSISFRIVYHSHHIYGKNAYHR